MMLKQGVVMDIDDAGIGDRLVFRILRTDIVAIDDGMNPVPVDQLARGGGDLFGALIGGIGKERGQRSSQDTAPGIDLFDSQDDAVSEFLSIRRRRPGKWHHAANRDGGLVSCRVLADHGQRVPGVSRTGSSSRS